MEELQKLIMDYQNVERQLQSFVLQRMQTEEEIYNLRKTKEYLQYAKDDVYKLSAGLGFKVSLEDAKKDIEDRLNKALKTIELYQIQEKKLKTKQEDLKTQLIEIQNKYEQKNKK